MTLHDDEQRAARLLEAGDYGGALRVMRGLAERDSVYALLSLGWIYETGAAGSQSIDTARCYYELAAEKGNNHAYLCLGRLFEGSGQENEARTAFERGSNLGNDECKSELARLDDEAAERMAGQALARGDYEEAAHILKSLVEHGSAYGMFSLGWICEAGAVGTPDWESATAYYARAAERGFLPAYFELGRLLERRGEEARARAAFDAGAERGHIACMSRLGRMMIEGRGGAMDMDAGSRWLRAAAEQGQVFAERSLLDIEERNARSVLERLAVKTKRVSLVLKGAIEMWKDPQSDKVR